MPTRAPAGATMRGTSNPTVMKSRCGKAPAIASGAAAAATANFDGCLNNGAQITIKLNSTMTVATR